ncbi:MAG: tetratricopeptide repeat protein [Myxococcota bacterium]
MAWGRKNVTNLKPEELAAAWRRGLRAAVAEDWATTESWLERVVEADSSDLDAYHALARLYRRQGAIGRAIRMHQNLLRRSDLPKKPRAEALLELARDFEAGGFTERASASYEEFLDGQPRHVEALEHLIPLLQELREHARALALIRRLRRREPRNADRLELEVLLAIARACADEGDHDGARRALKRCLRRDKNCGPAYALLGQLEAERGKSAKALDAWKRAAKTDPVLARELYPKLDAGFAANGKTGDFEAFLRDILSTRPQDGFARIALARALGSRGESIAAIEELARAIEVAPRELSLRAELGRQLLAANQDSEALKAYAELVDQIERSGAGEETPL